MDTGILDEILREAAPGPQPSFKVLHLLKAILVIGREGPIGRKRLSDKISLGSGAVRTLIQRLRYHKLISEEKQGCRLTETGLELNSMLKKRISHPLAIEAGRLSLGRYNIAILARGLASRISSGLEQRDAAVRVGAGGASTIIYDQGRFIIPRGSQDCARDYPNAIWDNLKTALEPNDGDIIIVSGGPSCHTAEDGALAAAWTLVVE